MKIFELALKRYGMQVECVREYIVYMSQLNGELLFWCFFKLLSVNCVCWRSVTKCMTHVLIGLCITGQRDRAWICVDGEYAFSAK